MKKALITGINGQDGSYLAEMLLAKGYQVYGLNRRKARVETVNIEHIKQHIQLIDGDMTDFSSLINAVKLSQPDEVYNLAAQSFVSTSWTQPIATSEMGGIGALNLLEAIRNIKPDARFYQASTSEMFGKAQQTPQNETTPFYPRSPYGVAKLFAHWMTVNYRESYGMFACSGILFNHESERRGKEFVTRKITDGVAHIKWGIQEWLELGNMDVKRDWGHAQDYVRAMWLMLQQDTPDDYTISTGETRSVREFVEKAFACADINLRWEGKGIHEQGIDEKTGTAVVRINPVFYRPAEVEMLLGDPKKAHEKLNWHREISYDQMVERMVKNDLQLVQNELKFQRL